MKKITLLAVAMSCAAAGGLAAGMAIAKSSYPPIQVLVSSGKSVIDQDLHYPPGPAQITAAIVTMQSGEESGWHKHDAPLFAWVLEGQVTVDYGEDGKKTYNKGDAFVEAFQTYHNGTNTYDGTTRILAVFSGSTEADNTTMR